MVEVCKQCNGTGDDWNYPVNCVACEKCGGSGKPPYCNDVIVVWVSCGAASAVAAKKTYEKYKAFCQVRLVNNPVAEEHPDNPRFLKDMGEWVGLPVETAINEKFPSCSAVEVWEKRKAMSFPNGAPCTIELKKQARYDFESLNKIDWHVLGFTADEKARYDNFVAGERKNTLPILIDAKITKAMCFEILAQAGLKLPEIYHLGYPNANCIGCVKATSPTYWNHVRRQHPDVFAQRAEQSRRLGVRLVRVNNERIFLDELDRATRGRPMKTMQMECGIFCEEKHDDRDNPESLPENSQFGVGA